MLSGLFLKKKTPRMQLNRAHELENCSRAIAIGFSQIKLLEGGLDGWKAKGYPVERYEKTFHLDSGQNGYLAAAG
jgi:hypothetical protein